MGDVLGDFDGYAFLAQIREFIGEGKAGRVTRLSKPGVAGAKSSRSDRVTSVPSWEGYVGQLHFAVWFDKSGAFCAGFNCPGSWRLFVGVQPPDEALRPLPIGNSAA